MRQRVKWPEPERAKRGFPAAPRGLCDLGAGIPGAGRRSGLTVIEVLVALGIFLLGSVSIIGLFVAATTMHVDAVHRRTCAFIAQDMLAEIQAKPLREVFAKTDVTFEGDSKSNPGPITVEAATPDPDMWPPDIEEPAAAFDKWPLPFDQNVTRNQGPILLAGDQTASVADEWAWYNDVKVNLSAPDELQRCDRGLWEGTMGDHDGLRVLQPRTWLYVLDAPITDAPGGPATVTVKGAPDSEPQGGAAPGTGYIVIDKEWMRYSSRDDSSFTLALDNDGNRDRGLGDSQRTAHKAGTPVTVAREHDRYPGYYYTVQFYPSNSKGSEAKVIVSVGYGNIRKLRKVFFFDTYYTPAKY